MLKEDGCLHKDLLYVDDGLGGLTGVGELWSITRSFPRSEITNIKELLNPLTDAIKNQPYISKPPIKTPFFFKTPISRLLSQIPCSPIHPDTITPAAEVVVPTLKKSSPCYFI